MQLARGRIPAATLCGCGGPWDFTMRGIVLLFQRMRNRKEEMRREGGRWRLEASSLGAEIAETWKKRRTLFDSFLMGVLGMPGGGSNCWLGFGGMPGWDFPAAPRNFIHRQNQTQTQTTYRFLIHARLPIICRLDVLSCRVFLLATPSRLNILDDPLKSTTPILFTQWYRTDPSRSRVKAPHQYPCQGFQWRS